MLCPQCNGEMWDNTTKKLSPKSPDYKCKNKDCKDAKGNVTAVWLKKGTSAPVQNKFVSPQEMAEKFGGTIVEPPVQRQAIPVDNKNLMMAESYVKDLYIAAMNFTSGDQEATESLVDHGVKCIKLGAKYLLSEF